MILQPDRLSRACLHLSASFSHPLHPCSPPFPGVHAVIAAPFTSSSYYRPLSVLPSPTLPHVTSHFRNLDFFFLKFPFVGLLSWARHHFAPRTSCLPGHLCPSTFLCALQTVPGPCSVFLHLPSFIHPPLACSGSPCGSVWSAHGIRCSLYSSRIQGAPGLPVGGDPPLQTTLRLEPDSGWLVLGCCM